MNQKKRRSNYEKKDEEDEDVDDKDEAGINIQINEEKNDEIINTSYSAKHRV